MGRKPSQADTSGLRLRPVPLALSLLPSAAVLILRPLGMSLPQAAVMAALLLAVLWWVSKLVDRTVTSLVLLAVFCLSGTAPLTAVFTFPLSETFLLIVLSFLFSEGIKNSGLPDKLLVPLLDRWATSFDRVLCSMLLVHLVMIFVIPQPFSRIILEAAIYDRFFRRIELPDLPRRILMLCLHMSAIFLNMAFLRGDLILNHALLSISGVSMTEGEWLRAMAVPSLLLTAVATAAFRLVFRRELRDFPPVRPQGSSRWEPTERRDLAVLAAILLLWATEGLHGISGTLILCAGTAAMFPLGLLKLPDLKCIDVKLLVFLTAAFSIGGVLKASGAAELLFSQFAGLFPKTFSAGYLLVLLLVTMLMHIVLGSSITTMSVVLPSLLVIAAGVVPLPILLFSVYIMASGHCLLPLHNVILMIGEGSGRFQGKELLRYGLAMTLPILLLVLTVYYGWWSLSL